MEDFFPSTPSPVFLAFSFNLLNEKGPCWIEKFQSSRVLSYVSIKQQDASPFLFSVALCPAFTPSDCLVPAVKQQDASPFSYSPSLSAQPLLRPTALCQP